MYKPGYKTSEFWFTLVSFIFSGLYLTGLINDNGQKEDLIRDVSHGVESIILIGGQLMILWKYVKSRSEVKEAYWNNTNLPTNTNTESKDNDKRRTNKSRSRKTNSNSKKQPTRSKKSSRS